MSKIIETTSVEYRYNNDDTALSEVNFELSRGESLAVIGPNGSGKSTLLNLLAKLHKPTSGCLTIQAKTPALVLQSNELNQTVPISVKEAVAMGRYPTIKLLKRFKTADHDLIKSSLQRLDITNLENSQLSELSGGQRQRTAVAQALCQDSDLLLLDEPVNGLDLPSRELIMEALEEELEKGRSVVLTTHNLDDANSCTKVLLLNGKQIAWGTPAQVLTEQNLEQAFGRHFTKIGDQMVIEDGHHH